MAGEARVKVYEDEEGLWRWRRTAGGRTAGSSEQGYKHRWYAVRKAHRRNPDVPDERFVVEERKARA